MTEILPKIIKEITQLILERLKAIIEENASHWFKSYESKSNKNLKENVDNFIYENQDIWHSKLDKRKDVMFKYLKCDRQILLYNECLGEEPMYITRKRRSSIWMGKRMSKRHQSLTRTKKAFEKDKAFIQRKSNSNKNKANEVIWNYH